MKNAFKGLLSSKKFIGSIVSMLVIVVATLALGLGFDLPEDMVNSVTLKLTVLAGTWLGAQGAADFGKGSHQLSLEAKK